MIPHTQFLFCIFFLFFFTSLLLKYSIASPISITLTPQILTKSGDSVRIQWSGIESPSDHDWLGIYSPPNSTDDHFIGYIRLSKCENWKSGSCYIDLPVVNIRSNYQFRIFRCEGIDWSELELGREQNPLPKTEHLLARSEELRFEGGYGPEQIHLAFTMKDDEMRVMFITGEGKKNYVKYGQTEDRMDEVVMTEVKRYHRSDMCDSPANSNVGWRDPGFIHDGVMKNLKKAKRYHYKVGSDEGGWSTTRSFISRDRNSDQTIVFLVGDTGTATPYTTFLRTQAESISTVKWLLRDIQALGDKPTFISHVGDISYARGHSWLWDTFFTQIEPLASKVPYHVCVGNHEYDWPLQPWKPEWAPLIYKKDSGGECGVPFSFKFNMPGNFSVPTRGQAPATRNLYYSFDAGVVHFLYLSTETDFLPGSEQYSFIKRDLETLDRTKTPFIVVHGHRPMYTSSSNYKDAPLRERMVEHLETLFVKNRVTVVFWGHVHRYERFCPMKKFTCGKNFPVNIVIGMGGQDWQPIWQPRTNHPNQPVFPQPSTSLFRASEFGYMRLVANKSKLTITYVGNHDGEIHDALEIPALDFNGEENQVLKKLQVLESLVNGDGEVEPKLHWLVKYGILLVVGMFIGYGIVFVINSRKGTSGSMTSWKTPLKSEV